MQIHNAIITGSFSYNGADLSNVTSSNAYSASLSSRTTDLESTSSVLVGASSSFSSILSSVSSSQQQLSSSFLTLTASFNAVSASQQQISSSYIALSASYNTFSGSASTRITVDSASLLQVSASQQQISASLLNVISIFATTGSNSFRANQSITGSLVVSSTITAQTLIVQTVTSSILYSSGSNIFGNQLANTQTFTGSVNITGSLVIAGNITSNGTAVMLGTGSANYLPKFTAASTIGDSLIFDSGSRVGIGIVSPSASLHVSGNIYATQGGNYQAPDVDCLLYLAGEDSTKRRLEIDAYSSSGPVIKGRQSSGTFSSPLPTLLDNTLLFIDAAGSEIIPPATTASFVPGFQGYTRLMAAENFTTSSRGTYWDWGLIPTGSIALTTGLMQLRTTGLTVNAPVIGTSFNNTTSTAYAKFIPSTAYSKKLVVFGSSVALGTGATSLQGWAYKLGQTLASGSWTYTNISIGGDDTIDLINRFYTDLVPLQPDVVIIGLSLANEGILNASGKDVIFNQYINNMYKLVDMCRQQGFKVIVTGCYPNNAYTSVEYNYCKQADKFLQTSQIPYINFLGSIDNGSGNWRTGMFADAAHPNDIGHESMYRAIPITLFDRLSYVQQDYKLDYPPLSTVQLAGDTTTASPIIYSPGTEPFGSWTFMLNVRCIPPAVGAVALLSVYNGTAVPLRVRNPASVWELATTATIVSSSVKSYSGYSSQLALTYDYYTDIVTLYVDAVNYGTSSTAGYGANPTAFSVFGRQDLPSVNANGYQVSNIAIYKAALNADQILECYNGFYPKSSLEVFSPCTDASIVSGSSLLNLATSKASLVIQSPLINSGSFQGDYPIIVTDTTYTLFPKTTTVIFNPPSACTVTLPNPAVYFGKTYTFKNNGSYAINNVTGSIIPLAGGSPTTSILSGSAGKYAVLQSNGTNWEIIQSN